MLEREPDWSRLRAQTPTDRRLVRRCLEKESAAGAIECAVGWNAGDEPAAASLSVLEPPRIVFEKRLNGVGQGAEQLPPSCVRTRGAVL